MSNHYDDGPTEAQFTATKEQIAAFMKAKADLSNAMASDVKLFLHPAELAFWEKHKWVDHLPDGRMISMCPHVCEAMGTEIKLVQPIKAA